ncbi:thioredoxin TrxC [Mariprofundus sp. EBB-1]|uniref:thioredoxin TrxC n=1 Tax=Mariprofundus sp. EBB-1 TaxID=2650971 RepID=UPI000EF17F6D|nr:thioredoxin TrxC [Mariprofundus sp. EBB-1]RLL56036.1 thioredoxin TrxC [Mariprofundus sp. EBB-1]
MPEHIHLTCDQCHAVNRLAREKLESTANCGACKHPLLNGNVKNMDQQQLDRFLANNDLPVIIDFWAPWCGPCKMMAPAFEKSAAELKKRVRFAKVNTEEQQAIAARFAIRSIPTLILFKHGREVSRQSGAMDATSLKRWLASA